MPIYIFQRPKSDEIIEVIQGVNDDHVFIDNEGVKWERVFTVPNASIDTRIDPFSEKDFSSKTKNKKGTVGDLMDASKEASEKRDRLTGRDPVKQEHFKNWSKARRGKKHPGSYED